ncbi:MAG: ABC transporter substrate-binding protein [Pseudolabrys sp.]|jgi:ABC-type nitrate/sulfonate/bicarbonate transport system substrate-binding protein|nr:ABC transporter substrate-binding protein [Pseudolabrys sp.]
MIKSTIAAVVGATICVLALVGSFPALAQDKAQGKRIVFAMPGIPPIFTVTITYVAEKEGFFKKHGANVEIRPFDTGTGAARAVVSGDIDMAWAPTPPVINQISNADVPLVAIFGMPKADWVLATTDNDKTCKDLVGQDVGVDSVGGARSVALRSMLAVCRNVRIEDIKQVSLGSNVSPAMIAGGLRYGVLHLDDVAAIEAQGKKLSTLLAMKDTNPNSHYVMLVVRKDNLAAKRDGIVRTVAGLIEAARFMQNPKNADAVAEAAMVTGHNKEVAKAALKQFIAIDFWPVKDNGLPRDELESVGKLMKKIGAIKSDKDPVSYERLVDASIWKDANAMVK